MSFNTAAASGGGAVVLTGAVQAVYSQEVLHAAQPVLRFAQFAEVKEELGRQPGDEINFLRYGDVTGSADLTEGTDMTTDNLTSSLLSIEVSEHGKALQCTELLLVTSFDDVMAQMTRKLGEHYARTVDGDIRTALRGAPNRVLVNSRAARTDLVDGDTLNMDAIVRAAEVLAINKCPKFDGDHYICFVHPHQASRLRRDPDWVQVVQYGDPSRVYNGEIGRIEDVRFISTTNTTVIKEDTGEIWADGSDTGATPETANADIDVYEAFMFGANAVGWASALPVEIRDNGVEDFGRKHSLAWYSIHGVGLIEEGHTVIIESA